METGINANFSLLQSRMNTLNTTGKVQQNYSEQEKTKLVETARGFESIFVNIMYKSMKSAMLDTMKDDNSKDMSFGADTLSGYTDMAFADQISNTGSGIGIAQMIYKQITGEELDSRMTIEGKQPLNNTNSNSQPSAEQQPAKIKFNLSGNNTNIATSGNLIERVSKRISNFEPIIQTAADKYDLPMSLIKAVITAESAGNPTAKSPVGAKGLMQLMDGTARGLGVTNSYDPKQNIMGGAKYLRQMLNTFDGELDKAVAAYNAGPGNVKKYGGIPPFAETQQYVKKVKGHIMAFNSAEKQNLKEY